jgi:hypothetical protein
MISLGKLEISHNGDSYNQEPEKHYKSGFGEFLFSRES